MLIKSIYREYENATSFLFALLQTSMNAQDLTQTSATPTLCAPIQKVLMYVAVWEVLVVMDEVV